MAITIVVDTNQPTTVNVENNASNNIEVIENKPINIAVSENQNIDCEVVTEKDVNLDILTNTIVKKQSGDYDFYDGPYSFTPSDVQQIASTDNKILESNIIINPIPSNYGLITWNGSQLTVS